MINKSPKFVDMSGHLAGSPPFVRHLEQGLISELSAHSVPVHPAQLYSSIASLLVFSIMLWLWKTKRARDSLLLIYLLLYALVRFGIEFIRDNEMAFWGLTIPQVVSIVMAILGLATFTIMRQSKLTNRRQQQM